LASGVAGPGWSISFETKKQITVKIPGTDRRIVNRAGRTGGTFLHTSRTNPAKVKKDRLPEHLRDAYTEEVNDITPEMLKNLDFLGIDYLIPIGGDDTLSYGVRMYQEGRQSRCDPENDGQ
jgi:6-phosphofructokinase